MQEFKRTPSAWEVYEKTKKMKSGEWVNDKVRDLAVSLVFPSYNSNLQLVICLFFTGQNIVE